MTILKPAQSGKLNFLIGFLLIIAGAMMWWSVAVYNSTVDLNHDIKLLQAQIKKAEVANADLKNKLYGILDPTRLEAAVQAKGFVKEKQPQYM